ncbi:5-formyltetrahydrofolate cyclo-ligase-like isoform X1 [Rhynchophorus ferrugineus]|uniref:5-formyltetrahydrofolate cyclo-ligase-like isoform X1 n=1 Tax=Rhynchophorus ferrugineus TaxID=354439 RepID=UPI003FCE0F90
MSIKETKNALRVEIKRIIASLSKKEKRRQSSIVLEKLLKLPVFQNSRRIAVYLSLSDEIDTEPIVRNILENGRDCFIPRCSKTDMQMVKLNSMRDWETLPSAKWNIKQPRLTETREDAFENGGLDLVICPGVAFTKYGHRLGHGSGYYDKFFAKLRLIQSPPPPTVALAFREQVVDKIPCEETDILIDNVLYE